MWDDLAKNLVGGENPYFLPPPSGQATHATLLSGKLLYREGATIGTIEIEFVAAFYFPAFLYGRFMPLALSLRESPRLSPRNSGDKSAYTCIPNQPGIPCEHTPRRLMRDGG